jgi:hypothetical protein
LGVLGFGLLRFGVTGAGHVGEEEATVSVCVVWFSAVKPVGGDVSQ